MPTPNYSLGTPGGVLSAVTAPKASTIAALLDLSAALEGKLTCQVDTGATAPTAATTFSAYSIYGDSSTNTLTSPVSVGATSIAVNSATAMGPGQKIALIAASTGKGEIVSITGAITGTGPYTVPVSGTVYSYLSTDHVYLIAQSTTYAISPMAATPVASQDYSGLLTVGTGQWILGINNTDTTEAVTVTVSLDKFLGFQ